MGNDCKDNNVELFLTSGCETSGSLSSHRSLNLMDRVSQTDTGCLASTQSDTTMDQDHSKQCESSKNQNISQAMGVSSDNIDKLPRRGSILQRQPKIEKDLSESLDENTNESRLSACNSSTETESQSTIIFNGSCLPKFDIVNKKREKSETFGRKIINSIIRSSSFTEKPFKKAELTTTKSLLIAPRASHEEANESAGCQNSEQLNTLDQHADTDSAQVTVYAATISSKDSPNSVSNLSQSEDIPETQVKANGRKCPRKLVLSNSVDVCQSTPQAPLSSKSLSDQKESVFQSASASNTNKKSKYTSLNSIFSSSNIFEHFPAAGGVGALTSRRTAAQRSLSTACDGSSSPSLAKESDAMSSTASLTSQSCAESEDTVSRLPKFSRIRVPSSLSLVPSKSIKLSSKNCYRLVILGSAKVGKSSLIAR